MLQSWTPGLSGIRRGVKTAAHGIDIDPGPFTVSNFHMHTSMERARERKAFVRQIFIELFFCGTGDVVAGKKQVLSPLEFIVQRDRETTCSGPL